MTPSELQSSASVQSTSENKPTPPEINVGFIKLSAFKRLPPLPVLAPPPRKRARHHDPFLSNDPTSSTNAKLPSLMPAIPRVNAVASTSHNLPKNLKFTENDLKAAIIWVISRKRPMSIEENVESWRRFSMKVRVIQSQVPTLSGAQRWTTQHPSHHRNDWLEFYYTHRNLFDSIEVACDSL